MWKYWACLAAMAVVSPLPPRLGYLVGRVVADVTFLLAKESRGGVASNARHALGPRASEGLINHVTLEVLRNTARNHYDLITLPRFKASEVEKRLEVHGWSRFQKALDGGRGVVLASIHMGSMDQAVQVINARAIKLTILHEVLEPPQFCRLNRRLRECHGISMLPVTYSGLKEAINRLKRGEVVAVACDRAIQGSGIFMDFLGEKTLMPAGAMELALRTGAAVVPAFAVRREGNSTAFFFEEPLLFSNNANKNDDIRGPLAEMVGLMEKYIRRYPDQWMVFEPVWNNATTPSGGASNRRNGSGAMPRGLSVGIAGAGNRQDRSEGAATSATMRVS